MHFACFYLFKLAQISTVALFFPEVEVSKIMVSPWHMHEA